MQAETEPTAMTWAGPKDIERKAVGQKAQGGLANSTV